MRRSTLLAAAAALAASPAIAQDRIMSAPQGGNQPMVHAMEMIDAPLISFSINQEIRRTPDRASFGAGVTTTAPTAVEAMRQNAVAMDRLVRAAKARGIADRDIQTSGINLSPQYDYSNQTPGVPPRLIGYQASNMVRVSTGNIANLGPLLDALVSAGGTNIDGPTFTSADPDAGLDGARETAVQRAAQRAQLYARAAGYRAARLVSLSEGGAEPPRPMPMMMARMAADSAPATPVQAGEVASSVTITVTYRLER